MVVFMFIALAVGKPLAPSEALVASTVTRDDCITASRETASTDSYLAVVFPWWSELVIAAVGCLVTVVMQRYVWSKNHTKKYKQFVANPFSTPKKDVVAEPRNSAPVAFADVQASPLSQRPLVTPGEMKQLIVAVKHGRAASLPDLLRRLVADNRSTCIHHARTSEFLVNVLRACASVGQFADGLKAYNAVACHVGSGTRCLWSVLMYASVEAGEFRRCIEFYQKLLLVGVPVGHDLVNVVRCVVRTGDLAGLEALLEDLVERKRANPGIVIDGNARNRALAACRHEGSPRFALVVASVVATSEAFDDALDVVSYNTLMTCYAQCRKLRRCLDTYGEMRAKGIVPTNVTLGILLEACVHEKDFARGRMLVTEFEAYGVKLNARHCASFLKGLIAAKHLEDAERVLQDMWQEEHARPDIIHYATLVRAHADNGDVASALRILDAMVEKSIPPDELICNAVLTACHKSCNAESSEALAAFEHLVTLGLQPSTITLSIFLKALACRGDFDSAMRVLETASERFGMRVEARCYIQLLQECVKAGCRAQALQVHALMEENARRCGQVLHEAIRKRLLRQCTFGAVQTAVTI
mmetsp:Transcript_106112/g.298306  ORF Transcript_106112/g.298306 Transcript_106112/m.298306 type:complete len:586 (+) Transcript_106112:1-1758(+)